MRLDAEHRGRTLRFALAVGLTALSVTCSKTWVLGPETGAGGAGAVTAAAGGGGFGGTPMQGGTGGFPGFGGHTDPGTGGHGSGMCSTRYLPFDTPPTDVVFVVGRNYSMMSKFGDTSRMIAVQMDVHTVINNNQYVAEFGYEGYPSFTGCSSGGTCCAASDQVIKPGTSPDIDSALYAPCDPSGSGPGSGCVAPTDSRAIAQSLSWNVIGDLFSSATDPASQRYVVLIADGPPGCPSEDASAACGAAESAVSALLKNAGIKTFVVGVGDTADGDICLGQMATMGGTGMPYVASDSGSLMKALTQVIGVISVTPCTIVLSQTPEDHSLVAVNVANKEIPYDMTEQNGWNFVSPTRIQLHGTSCQYLQNFHSAPLIGIAYGCPPCMVSGSAPYCQ